jgi:large subunit ribosomal protein L25
MIHEISVACLPKSIPSEIVVDVTKLGLGQSIHARDIVLPEGVTLVDEPEETIVTVVAAGGEAAESGKPS